VKGIGSSSAGMGFYGCGLGLGSYLTAKSLLNFGNYECLLGSSILFLLGSIVCFLGLGLYIYDALLVLVALDNGAEVGLELRVSYPKHVNQPVKLL
jgi:hypothetical protein